MARPAGPARAGRAGAGRRADPLGAAAGRRGRWRRRLQRGDRRAARLRRGDRHPRRGDPGRQGLAALRPPAGAGRRGQHRYDGRQHARPRGRPGDRGRHPLQRLHHRVPDRVPGPRRAVRQRQRRRLGRRQARRARRWSPMPGPRWTPCTSALAGWSADRPSTASGPPRWPPRGTRPCSAPTPWATARGRPSRRSSAWSTRCPDRVTWWCARPARCPATCTSCGAPATRKGYHVEYGYSCMGYEIAGGLGVRMACPDRDVFVMVGDGSYLMMAQELVTAVQESIKIIVVLVQNHGFASIGALSESVGAQRFGTSYRYRDPGTGRLDGDVLPVDLAANAASLGVQVLRADGVDELRAALLEAKRRRRPGPGARRDRPAGPGARQRGRGGTSRWPRSRRSTPPGGPRRLRAAQGRPAPLPLTTARDRGRRRPR